MHSLVLILSILHLEFSLAYSDTNIKCWFLFLTVNGKPGRGIPVLNEDGHIISDIRGGKAADVASHSEVFALSDKR